MTRILLVDDDAVFTATLSAAFEKRGHQVATAHHHEEALLQARSYAPEWIVLDLKIPGTSGLRLIPALLAECPHAHIVVLTGYANIATAVEAIKLGAKHYLSKPVGLDEIIAAFGKVEGDESVPIPHPPTDARLDKMEWAHIHAVLDKNAGNISAAARELQIHRRTLQRKLHKTPR